MISDINKDVSNSKLISFADDTQIITKIHTFNVCSAVTVGTVEWCV